VPSAPLHGPHSLDAELRERIAKIVRPGVNRKPTADTSYGEHALKPPFGSGSRSAPAEQRRAPRGCTI
jgi:hypothetical protein